MSVPIYLVFRSLCGHTMIKLIFVFFIAIEGMVGCIPVLEKQDIASTFQDCSFKKNPSVFFECSQCGKKFFSRKAMLSHICQGIFKPKKCRCGAPRPEIHRCLEIPRIPELFPGIPSREKKEILPFPVRPIGKIFQEIGTLCRPFEKKLTYKNGGCIKGPGPEKSKLFAKGCIEVRIRDWEIRVCKG